MQTYERVEQDGDIKKVHVEINGKKRIIEAEQLLIATGRKPNTESLNLHAAGVEVGSRGEIVIDDYLKRPIPEFIQLEMSLSVPNLFM